MPFIGDFYTEFNEALNMVTTTGVPVLIRTETEKVAALVSLEDFRFLERVPGRDRRRKMFLGTQTFTLHDIDDPAVRSDLDWKEERDRVVRQREFDKMIGVLPPGDVHMDADLRGRQLGLDLGALAGSEPPRNSVDGAKTPREDEHHGG